MPGTVGRSGGHNRRGASRKQLHGTARPDREDEPTFTPGRPERPAWLTDEVAIAAWERVCGLLEARGTLSAGDADAVLLVAVAEAEYRRADALIEAEGLVVGGAAHPAVRIRADAWKRWSAALSRLGLDPVTRSRVEPAAPLKDENPFLKFG